MSAPGGSRVGSLETKLVLVTSIVLVLVSATHFLQLAARERTKLVEAKATAASMLLDLLTTEIAAAIDFGDADDVAARLNDLHANPDIVGAAVWPDAAAQPSARWAAADAPPLTSPTASDPDGAATTVDWLVATKTVLGPSGSRLARARVIFTLRPENEALRKSRLRLFWITAAFTGATALLLGLLARRYVVAPLRRVAQAATALANGNLSARVDIRTNDELGDLARAFNVMGKAVAFREERLQKEIGLAQRIQTSILPRTLDVPDLAIAALMIPTSRVGGDYYDVLPVENGCWIGIGDVAGHGLDAGLMMLMMQSIVAALVARNPDASPKDVVCLLNEVLFDNIRNRLRRDDHATLTVLHYDRSGRVLFAGAHEDIIVYRADRSVCEVIATPGTWVGGRHDIRQGTVESSLLLEPGDVMLLHTDGATETRNRRGEEFGIERLCAELERVHVQPVASILDHLVEKVWGWGKADDDVSFVVFRYKG